MKARMSDISSKQMNEPLEDADPDLDEDPGSPTFSKSKIECICPGCGKMHVMKMNWIGRGVPRKFCQNCRDRETPLDDDT